MNKRASELVPVMRAAVRSGALRAVVEIQDQTRASDTVDTGRYLRSWKTQPTENGVVISNDSPYAGIIELGRRAGSRMPPVQVIARWAQRRLGLSRREAEHAAWAIAKSIAVKGIAAKRVLGKAMPAVRKIIREEVLRELARFFTSTGGL